MKNSKDIFKLEKEFLLQTYKRIPIEISHGKGVYLYSSDGKKYLDFFSGLAVNALGYGNEKLIQAVEEQLKKYLHLSNFYVSRTQIELAEKLIKYSGLNKVFFSNSGTEAVEASVKLIRKFAGPEKKLINFSNAFHGRTYGALSLGGKEQYKKQFSPLSPNIIQLEFNNVEQLEKNINSEIGAVFIEFIQGEGGISLASNEFVDKLKSLKEKYDFILVADEVQSGVGRTGKPFAFNYFDVVPDLVIVAKAIGGGLPLGALIVNQKYSEVLSYGDHGSTFGGNPVSCAAGLAVIDEIFEKGIMNDVAKLGDYFLSELRKFQKEYSDKIRDVRGLGFMIGVELIEKCSEIIEKFRRKGILLNCTHENVIRILPPLISTRENIDNFLKVFRSII
jgi:predicted acetylornithine/succinylornithine family transaminase